LGGGVGAGLIGTGGDALVGEGVVEFIGGAGAVEFPNEKGTELEPVDIGVANELSWRIGKISHIKENSLPVGRLEENVHL
jgi:hypothetical protein